MLTYTINWLPLIIAVIINMIIGWFWYSPKGFGKYWMRVNGITMPTPEEMKSGRSMMMRSLLIQVIITIISLYIFMGLGAGIQLGLILWLGFIVPATIGSVLWERKPWELFALNAGNQLVNLIVASIVFSFWR